MTSTEFDREFKRRTGLPADAPLDGSVTVDQLRLDSLSRLELTVWLEEQGVAMDAGMTVDDLRSRCAAPVEGVRRHDEFFELVPIDAELVSYVYQLSISTDVGFRWRFRGAVPNYESFEASFWQGTLAQFVAVDRDTRQPAGHVVCYNPEHGHGYAYVGAVFESAYTGTGQAMGAVKTFVEYVFTTWAFRKLYMELPEYNYDQFASGEGRVFEVEGRLRQHDYYSGRYWDRLLLAIYRPHIGFGQLNTPSS